MPELPEVETARRLAERALVGHRIVEVATVEDSIVYEGVTPAAFAAALAGRRVLAARRRGKHLWLELDQPPHPLFHFGMTGSFQLYTDPAQRPRFWKVELLTEIGQRLAMPNPRRLGRLRLRQDPEHEPPIGDLGFDPLLDLPPLATFRDLLARRTAPIKAVLLDQRFAAGVGNWVADEILYQARIDPRRRTPELSDLEIARLRTKMRQIVRQAVEVDADKDRFPSTWLFHHRWGKQAGAVTDQGEKIVHETIAGRTTAWVPAVQK